MPAVYVTEQGARVGTQGGRLVVTAEDRTLLSVPLEEVDQLVVVGRGVQVTTAALAELLKRGGQVTYLTRSGRFLGRVDGGQGGAVELRAAQFRWATDPGRSAAMARALVAGKVAHQAALLRKLNAPGAAELSAALAGLRGAETVDRVRGLEGAAAAAYFRALAGLLPPEVGFRGRSYHPPADPANAALSLGYSLVLAEVVGRLHVVGLDPYAGFLHAMEAGRPNLGLDMEEEYRPLVDDLVVRLFARGELGCSDFTRDGKGFLMEPDPRRRFLAAYEEQLAGRVTHPLARGRVTLRQTFELQARQLGRVLAGGRERWEPVRLGELWR